VRVRGIDERDVVLVPLRLVQASRGEDGARIEDPSVGRPGFGALRVRGGGGVGAGGIRTPAGTGVRGRAATVRDGDATAGVRGRAGTGVRIGPTARGTAR